MRSCWSQGTPLSGGFGSSSAPPLRDGPYAMQTGSRQARCRRLAAQGQWDGTLRGGGGRSRGGKCTAGWTTSVTPCFRFPWRPCCTPTPTPPTTTTTPYSSRSGSTHSPRAHSMLPDRPGCVCGVGGAGFSSFAPRSCS